MTQKIPQPITDDACKKVVYLLRAMGPCTSGEIKRELIKQCAGVKHDNVCDIYELAMPTLHTKNVVEWDHDNVSWDINPFMYDDDNKWIGPAIYNFD